LADGKDLLILTKANVANFPHKPQLKCLVLKVYPSSGLHKKDQKTTTELHLEPKKMTLNDLQQ